MTDRDRLTGLFKEALLKWENLRNAYLEEKIDDIDNFDDVIIDNLIANGVIAPPCKVGDTVYALYNGKVLKANIFSMKIETEDDKYVYMPKLKIFDHLFQFKTFLLGKTVFLTPEEAEKALQVYKENS